MIGVLADHVDAPRPEIRRHARTLTTCRRPRIRSRALGASGALVGLAPRDSAQANFANAAATSTLIAMSSRELIFVEAGNAAISSALPQRYNRHVVIRPAWSDNELKGSWRRLRERSQARIEPGILIERHDRLLDEEVGMPNEKGQGPKADSGPKAPNERQQQILDAYFECPNAAAVARALKGSERNVRRIVQQFDNLLVERRQQRFAETFQRIDARHARTQDWADSTLGEDLGRLDELAASKNEGVALRATRMKLDIALVAPSAASIPQTSEADRLLQLLQRALADRLAGLENDPYQGGEGA